MPQSEIDLSSRLAASKSPLNRGINIPTQTAKIGEELPATT
jgi:hypothetical protein